MQGGGAPPLHPRSVYSAFSVEYKIPLRRISDRRERPLPWDLTVHGKFNVYDACVEAKDLIQGGDGGEESHINNSIIECFPKERLKDYVKSLAKESYIDGVQDYTFLCVYNS